MTAIPSDRRHADIAAWIIVGFCFLALAVSFSARSSLSLVMTSMEKELGWSRDQVSNALSLAQIFMAIASPIVGNLVDRFSPRLLLSSGLAIVGGGILLTSDATATWQLNLAYGVIGGIGFGTAATHVVSTIVSHHFVERRGLAIGIATAGATGGQLVMIPLLARVLDYTDWRTCYVVIGVGVLALAPLVFLLIRPRAADDMARAARRAGSEPLKERLAFLLRSPTFHLLFWSYFICGITTSGVIEGHLIPYAEFCGFTVAASSDAFGLLMAFNLGGMVLAGWLTDRMNRPLLLGAIYVLRALSFILLLFIADDYPLLITFAVMFGVFDYSTVPVTASLAASHLGLRVMGLSMGLLTAGHALGAALGAKMGGLLFDLFVTYSWTWLVALITALIAGVLCFIIRENRDRGWLIPAAA
jgi:MFS family permease